jgi:hypothetical protein
MSENEIMDKLYPKKDVEKVKYGWQIIEKHVYSEKCLSFGFGIPTKKSGLIYVLQHQVTGDIKFMKVITNVSRLHTDNTYVPQAQV